MSKNKKIQTVVRTTCLVIELGDCLKYHMWDELRDFFESNFKMYFFLARVF